MPLDMLIKHWITATLTLSLLNVTCALNCTSYKVCYVQPGTESFAEQVIEASQKYFNKSFTILVYAGNYNATNGSLINFYFRNVIIKKHPDNLMPVNIMCPEITFDSINGIGFVDSMNIEISGLNFMGCGVVTSGLYFRNTVNVIVRDSTFHHNSDNGLQIMLGNNFSVINCSFYSNIGLQPDNLSDLITNDVLRIRGVGLGIFFENQTDVRVTIEGCNFTNNIAYKPPDYHTTDETRPYGFIPFGNGGGFYLKLNKVNNSFINISNSSFRNNTAIHQGGAIVMIPIDSVNNTLNIFGCTFVGNKVLGFVLRNFNVIVNKTDASTIDNFIDEINKSFSIAKLNPDFLRNLSFDRLVMRPTGGSGGAIAVSLYGSVEYNTLNVSTSWFVENGAILAGAIDFVVRDLLSKVENGIDSNQAFIDNCDFYHNVALSGSAIRVASYSRVDIPSLPIKINNCTFKKNDNLRNQVIPFVNLFGTSGTVIGIRFPVNFTGTNVFQSNLGGGVNINHARINVHGHMKFFNNHQARYGGAVRLGEITLMHILPNTTLEFINNSATDFGGGIAVNNFFGENDTTLVLNNFCFIQYDIGGTYEYKPDNWSVSFTFINNTLTNKNGQGQDFYAEDTSYCVIGRNVNNTKANKVFDSSVFSSTHIFNFSQKEGSSNRNFETSPNALNLEKSTLKVSLGEIFDLNINATDDNGNYKDAIYSYYTPRSLMIRPLNTIVIDLDPDEDTLSNFASVNRATEQNPAFTVQKTLLVAHSAEKINNCLINFKNSQSLNYSFNLNLIDSSDGQVIYRAAINSKILCCHVAYQYDNSTGKCEFLYNNNSRLKDSTSTIVLREDKTKKYIYIRSDQYGGFKDRKFFSTATIPLSYQHCTQERKLPGCLIKDDNLAEQCSQKRSGFLCGRCARDSEPKEGTALNLIECVSCEKWHIVIFIMICILIVGISFLIIYYNIYLPNALKGFLFFIQVVGYVYRTGVKNGALQWHFYLSRLFGFSLFFPLCISSELDAVSVALLGFLTPLIMTMCAFIYIVFARFIPHLGRRQAVHGIWFLVLIAYVYTADTCLNLLRCVQVNVLRPTAADFNGTRVYYFDGELECFRGKHLPYGVTAVIITVIVLISFPIYVLAITFNFIKKSGPLRDVISSGIEKECHWWSGYDLFRRLLFFAVYLLSENFINDYTQLSLTIVALLILVITSRVHPYTNKWANLAEGLILLDLVFISAYFLNYNRLSNTSNDKFVIMLLILPFIYFFLYLMIKVLSKRCLSTASKLKYFASDSFASTSNSLLRGLNSIFAASNEDLHTALVITASNEDAMYEDFRDELDDFVTVKD